MFSNLSSSSISLATVTPSLVMRGAPNDFSITTLRPLGPSVTFTALARVSTPRSIRSRASVENFTSLAAIGIVLLGNLLSGVARFAASLPGLSRQSITSRRWMDARIKSGHDGGERGACDRLGDHAHDVGLLHDQEVLAVDLDLGARPLAEQHLVAGLQVDRDQLAGLVAAARANGDDLALRRLLLGGVGDDDAALGLLFGIDAAHDNAVVERTKLGLGHWGPRGV